MQQWLRDTFHTNYEMVEVRSAPWTTVPATDSFHFIRLPLGFLHVQDVHLYTAEDGDLLTQPEWCAHAYICLFRHPTMLEQIRDAKTPLWIYPDGRVETIDDVSELSPRYRSRPVNKFRSVGDVYVMDPDSTEANALFPMLGGVLLFFANRIKY